MPLLAVVVIGVIVMVGSYVQTTIGLGLGMLGAPLIALIEPTLLPTMLLMLATVVSFGVMVAEWSHVSWRTISWTLPARIPGTILGVWLATTFNHRVLGVVIAIAVLAAVALTVGAVEVRQSPLTLVTAGFAAGTTGTAAAIGGPAMAIVMAHRPMEEVRATLSVFFVVGSVMSVLWFQVQDALPRAAVSLTILYLPIVAGAMMLGSRTHRRIPRETFRRAVLALCAASALILLVKSLTG